MKSEIDYYFCLLSPWAYLGFQRADEIAASHGTSLNYIPIKIRKVFAETGGVLLKNRSRQRKAYRIMDLKRWSRYRDVPLNLAPKFEFPESDADAARTVIAAIRTGLDPGPLVFGYLKAMWIEERDISDPATIGTIVEESGFDARSLLDESCTPEVESIYEANTRNAVESGVFGVPTWVLNGEVFWGQDRLDFLDHALTRLPGTG